MVTLVKHGPLAETMQIFYLNIMSDPSQSLSFTYFCVFIYTFFLFWPSLKHKCCLQREPSKISQQFQDTVSDICKKRIETPQIEWFLQQIWSSTKPKICMISFTRSWLSNNGLFFSEAQCCYLNDDMRLKPLLNCCYFFTSIF